MYTIDAKIIEDIVKLRRMEEEGLNLTKPTLHDLTRTHGIDYVASEIDCNPRTLEQWRCGRRTMPLDIMAKLVHRFGMDVERFILDTARTRIDKGYTTISADWLTIHPDFMEIK